MTQGYFKTKNDASAILQRLAMTTVGRNAGLRFIRENAVAIKAYFGSTSVIANVYSSASSYVGTPAELGTVRFYEMQMHL